MSHLRRVQGIGRGSRIVAQARSWLCPRSVVSGDAPWEGLTAADLFTVEVLTLGGLRRYFVLFVLELKTRPVQIAGIHHQPYGEWMEQMARNLTDAVEGFLRGGRHLIHDRDPLYTRTFLEILNSSGSVDC